MRNVIAYFILFALSVVVFYILTLPRRKPPTPSLRGRVCRHCKGDNAPDARYCGRCGQKIDGEAG